MEAEKRRAAFDGVLVIAADGQPARQAAAQLDPLLYLKRTKPTVLIAVETANRMQRDTDGNYRDDNVYVRLFGGATTGASRRTSSGVMSERKPQKVECLMLPSPVHSTNSTSTTSAGRT